MRKLDLEMTSQPDDTTCGPTCLHALYSYMGLDIELSTVINDIEQFEKGGGTLGVILAKHALTMGLDVSMYSYNLKVFDPSWFGLSSDELIEKLQETLKRRNYDEKYKLACEACIDYLALGGKIKFADLTQDLIFNILKNDQPIITGLSSTWLYQDMREEPMTTDYDDIEGDPAGHFVVIYGYNSQTNTVSIADPHLHNPLGDEHYYDVPVERLITAILLGVITYDGNLVIIQKRA